MNQSYCSNCGKNGHIFKKCDEPITSYGLICFNINNFPNLLNRIENFLYNKFIKIEDYNYLNLEYINNVNKYKKDIKFLIIQRKHSLSYIEFLRGLYNENEHEHIKKIFSYMSKNEIEMIKTSDFQLLWDDLWQKTAYTKSFTKEMNTSTKKFNYLKSINFFESVSTVYDTPEWGFPKGRRNKYEKNIDCAIREFTEETNFKNFTIFDRINHLTETFNGTNNIEYKHVYWVGGTEKPDIEFDNDTYEVGNIGWFTIDEILKLFRPYDTTKINLINQLYFFLTITIEKINKSNNYLSIN
jgi:ADP-ribose pyrophosphatase YjhB (NUDIX family)